MKSLVFNGWATGPETWELCTFPHDWVFDYVEQLDGLPERVMDETDAAVLVGFSMGGMTALRMLLRNPEKVKGLVLVSSTARMMEDKAADWKGMSLRRRRALMLGTQMVFADDPSPMYEESNMRRGLDYLQEMDVRDELTRRAGEFARIPVAILQSERDFIVYAHNAAFLKGVFPQAEVTMVPGNEHVLPIKVPELIDAAVNGILRGLGLSDAGDGDLV